MLRPFASVVGFCGWITKWSWIRSCSCFISRGLLPLTFPRSLLHDLSPGLRRVYVLEDLFLLPFVLPSLDDDSLISSGFLRLRLFLFGFLLFIFAFRFFLFFVGRSFLTILPFFFLRFFFLLASLRFSAFALSSSISLMRASPVASASAAK